MFEKIISKEHPECAVSEADILRIERVFDIEIPKLLREYYLRCNGAAVKTLYASGCDHISFGLHAIDALIYRMKYSADNSVTFVNDGEGSFEKTVRMFKDYDVVRDNHLIPFACDEGGELYYWQKGTSAVYIIFADDFDNPVKAFESIEDFFEAFAKAADDKQELDDLKPSQSLEELENDRWGEPEFGSYVVTTSHSARQKPINKLTDEEIRLLIGQKIGLKYLLPIAVKMVELCPDRMITFFPGDLMKCLLNLDNEDWKDNKDDMEQFRKIVTENIDRIIVIKEISFDLINRLIGTNGDSIS